MRCLVWIIGIALMSTPAFAEVLVAKEDVILCTYPQDLVQAESSWKAHDAKGISLYMGADQSPCLMLKRGEPADLLDRSDERVQVVTRHRTPRFIGWGDQRSFIFP